MKIIAPLAILLLSLFAVAAGGGHGDSAIPLAHIGWQAANLGILLVAIFFFVRKSIVTTFQNRQKDYLDKSEKTKSALKQAESALTGIKAKLAGLEAGEKKSIESARTEAELLRTNFIRDAEISALKIKSDTTLTIQNELTKAKAEINDLMLSQAVATAKTSIAENNKLNALGQEAAFIKQLERVKT